MKALQQKANTEADTRLLRTGTYYSIHLILTVRKNGI